MPPVDGRRSKRSQSMKSIGILAGILIKGSIAVIWEQWWTYDGISGPSFWGLINPDWNMCNQGRQQSPIDVEPEKLLYDATLADLVIEEQRVDGELSNSGHGIVFSLDPTLSGTVNISGGPVSYNFPIYSLSIHFGLTDDSGSEHSINGRQFPGEIQILGFNADLYENESVAVKHPHGLVAVSILLQVGELSNRELRKITEKLKDIQYAGQKGRVHRLSFAHLLPETRSFITYDGSLTEPGCQETVTWIIMNKPIYITPQQLGSLRKMMQGESSDPRAPLGGNARPIQALNARTMRTNVYLTSKQESKCPTLETNMFYKASIASTAS